MTVSRLAFSVLVLVVLVIGFAIGFLAGYLGRPSWLGAGPEAPTTTMPCFGADEGVTRAPEKGRKPPVAAITELGHQDDTPGDGDYGGYVHEDDEALEELGAKLMEELNAENIKTYLRRLVKQPRMTGTVGDHKMATALRDFFKEQSFDTAKLVPYNVLLSFPDQGSANHVELYDRRDSLVFTSQYEKDPTDHTPNGTGNVPPFSAYSAVGSPKGELVYVNYGRVEDFHWLRNRMDIDVMGKICIMRRGKIHSSVKLTNAERFGAAGLILYTDPPLDTSGGSDQYLPDADPVSPDGVLRGTLLAEPGDPLTPGRPAIAGAYRLSKSKANLPRIPVHPLRAEDAQMLLNLMGGKQVDMEWQGSLPISYHYGPGFLRESTFRKVQIKVSNRNTNATVHNVIGVIRGRLEPDRYVVVSSHHDTWTSGSVDSTSGAAIMMELARAMGKLLKAGWRPRRSIMFCSWAATNYGQIGSTEWVEQFQQLLTERAVGVINVGMAVQGNFTFNGEGTPLAHSIMRDISKHILNPDKHEKSLGRTRVYDTWLKRQTSISRHWGSHIKPSILPPDPRSDVAPFLSALGITGVNVAFISNQAAEESWPLSSCIDCSTQRKLSTIEESIDPNYEFHLAVTRYVGELMRRLSEHTLLPYDVRDYATTLQSYLTYFTEENNQILKTRGMSSGLEYLQEAVTTFHMATEQFVQTLGRLNKSDPLAVRMINDRLLSLERAFVDSHGPPGRPSPRHILYSGNGRSLKAPFPGLTDSLAEARESTVNSAEKWEEVERQLSLLITFINEAASVLKPAAEFF